MAVANQKGPQESLYMKRLRLRHPIFSKLSFPAFKYLVDCSYLIRPVRGDVVLHEGKQ